MKLPIIKSKYFDHYLLSAFVLLLIISNAIWTKIDIEPPHWDAARHLWTSLNYYDLITNWLGHITQLGYLKQIVLNYYYYPPFYYISTFPFYYIFGKSVDVALMVNNVYLVAMVFSIYGIGKKLWNRNVGILSALFISLSPMIISFYRDYMIDMPMLSFLALSIYLLLISDKYKNTFYSFLFGLAMAIGTMIRWTMPIFIIGPVLYIVVEAVFDFTKNRDKKLFIKRIFNFILSKVVALILIFPWFYYNKTQLLYDFKNNSMVSVPEKGAFLLHLINIHTYLLLFIFFAIGFIITFTKKRFLVKNLFLIFSLITSLAISYFLIKNHDPRYSLPWLVFGSVLAAFWIPEIKARFLRYLVVAIFIVILSFNFYAVSFGFKSLSTKAQMTVYNFPLTIYNQYGYNLGSPIKDDWKIEEILADIKNDAINSGKNTEPLVLTSFLDDYKYFSNWSINYYCTLTYPENKIKFQEFDKPYIGDYLITRFGDPKLNANGNEQKKFDKIINNSYPIKYDLVSVKTYQLPAGTQAKLYRIVLNNKSWQMDLGSKNISYIGEITGDANNQAIAYKERKPATFVWGPYLPFDEGNYKLNAELQTSDNSSKDSIARIEVSTHAYNGDIFYGILDIKGTDFASKDRWQTFNLDFKNPNHIDKLEFRIVSAGTSDISVKNILVNKTSNSLDNK